MKLLIGKAIFHDHKIRFFLAILPKESQTTDPQKTAFIKAYTSKSEEYSSDNLNGTLTKYVNSLI